MSAKAERFARLVLDGFTARGLHTDPEVIKAGGPSTSQMTLLRKVADPDDETTMSEPREPTWTKVDRAAGWVPGSARRVWNGGEPEPVGTSEQDAGYVASPGEKKPAGVSDDEVLREIRAMRDDVRELSERVARIEQQGS